MNSMMIQRYTLQSDEIELSTIITYFKCILKTSSFARRKQNYPALCIRILTFNDNTLSLILCGFRQKM